MNHGYRSATVKATVVVCLTSASLAAQSPIPLRTIGPILSRTTENVGTAVTVRSLPDGRVIVGAPARWRVYSFDASLQRFSVVVDSLSGTGTSAPLTTVFRYVGDSTLLPDWNSNALLVLDGNGKIIR